MRTISSPSSARFALTPLDVLRLFIFKVTFYLVTLGGALFYLAVRESLTKLRGLVSLLFLFK